MATYWMKTTALVFLLCVLGSCSGPSIQGLSPGEALVIEDGGDTVTYSDADSDLTVTSGDGVVVPDRFPSDFPLPDSATLVTAAENDGLVLLNFEWEGLTKADFSAYIEKAKAAGYSDVVEVVDLDLGGGAFNTGLSLANGIHEVVVSALGDSAGYGQLSLTSGPASQ